MELSTYYLCKNFLFIMTILIFHTCFHFEFWIGPLVVENADFEAEESYLLGDLVEVQKFW